MIGKNIRAARLSFMPLIPALIMALLMLSPRIASSGEPSPRCPEGLDPVIGKSEDGRKANWCEKGGLKEGPYVEFHASGAVRTRAEFKKGLKNGRFVRFHENGKKESEGFFKDDLQHGDWTRWHESGQKRDEGKWKNDRPNGIWRAWNPGGTPAFEGRFDQGAREGEWTFWHESGRKKELVLFKNGKRVCLISGWDESGKKVSETQDLLEKGCSGIATREGFHWNLMQVFSISAAAPIGYVGGGDSSGFGLGWAPLYQTGWKWLRFRGHLRAFSLKGETQDPWSGVGFRAGLALSFLIFDKLTLEFGPGVNHFGYLGSAEGGELAIGWRFDRALGFIDEIYISGGDLRFDPDSPLARATTSRVGFTTRF